MKRIMLIVALSVPAAACADLTPTQQRALTGTTAGTQGVRRKLVFMPHFRHSPMPGKRRYL
jgi:hypothetical protein